MASKKPGWLVVDFDGTSLLCVEKDDSMNKFNSDFEAAQAYIKAGGKIINTNLPFNLCLFPIDTPENRKLLKRAVCVPCLKVNDNFNYIKKTGKTFLTTTDEIREAKKLHFYEISAYLSKVIESLKSQGYKQYKLYIDLLEIKRSNNDK